MQRKHERKYPELTVPGEKVQIDVKEVPYCCLRGELKRNGKHLYQWTAIDECTRIRFIYGFEEHTPENTVKFFKMLQKAFPFKIQTIQTDNGTEFTYKYISDETECPFDTILRKAGVEHKLIPPRTPWHNGKVERSHRNDQRYFYDWEHFILYGVFFYAYNTNRSVFTDSQIIHSSKPYEKGGSKCLSQFLISRGG